jgi:hypothetical protein
MPQNYIIQPEYGLDRNADYKLGNYVKHSFRPIKPEEISSNIAFTCGNIKNFFAYDIEKKEVIVVNEHVYPLPEHLKSIYETISSPLVLYRLLAIFGPMNICSDGYKSVWNFTFMHEETKSILTLYDYKGAFSFGSEFSNISQVPDSFKKDLLKLFNLICSNQSPHPYDRCVAGSVA